MAFGDAFILVIPVLLLLLAVGAMASRIEQAGYHLYGTEADKTDADGRTPRELGKLHGERSMELARLRQEAAELDQRIAEAQRERANLLAQEQNLGNAAANFVAEAGYPTHGALGFYCKLDGPATVMPFAGLASAATAMSGKRLVRLVVWGLGQAEAQNFAMNWAGEGARLLTMRPFEGTLFWHEA
ncbi:MAG TPA: hypothetical protein VF194_03410 [Ferrovibrio sp.]|jgi:hypothetical protein|uniref:hypothetical protein n=1 Tax=Ferrovibrio sp. TaxID=1917215 RepID=UPI002ED332DC